MNLGHEQSARSIHLHAVQVAHPPNTPHAMLSTAGTVTKMTRPSHYGAPALPTLRQVSWCLFLLTQRSAEPSLHPLHFQRLLTSVVPPPQPLDRAAVRIIYTDGPFAAAHLGGQAVSREMVLWKKDFGRSILHSTVLAIQSQGEDTIAQIKARRQHVTYRGVGTGPDIRLRGAIARIATNVGWRGRPLE